MNDFISSYSKHGPDVYKISEHQLNGRDGQEIIEDAISLFGCLLGLVRKINKYQILSKFEHSPFGNHNDPNSNYPDFRDGIMAWKAFTEHFDKMGNKEVYIHSLSNTINKPYKYHPEGIIGWIHEKEQAYSEMEDISEYSMPDNLKKTTLLQQLGNHGSEWWRG